MTGVSLTYLLLGVAALLWPLALLFFRREVLGAQWLIAVTMLLFGFSLITFSTLFNSFLEGEYLLVLLFMIFALTTPPVAYLSMVSLMNPRGITGRNKLLFYPSLAFMLLLVMSVALGGPDMYRLWIDRGTDGYAHAFYAGSWRYNTIVAIHYYLFYLLLLAEIVFLVVAGAGMMRRYKRLLSEYYTIDTHHERQAQRILLGELIVATAVCLGYLLFPFNSARPLWASVVECVAAAAGLMIVGWNLYHIGYGAEKLASLQRRQMLPKAIGPMSRSVSRHIEQNRLFLDPDLSVHMLADRLHLSEDDIVDAIHHLHGITFGNYIDGLRVNYGTKLLLDPATSHSTDPENVTILAHRCGFLNAQALESALMRELNKPLREWLA